MAQNPSPFRVLAAGMAWRLFGGRNSAETLFRAMSGDDEQNRMLAGISFVKAGQRSIDFIEQKIDAGAASPPVIRLLADLDEDAARDVLNRVANSPDDELAQTARRCIDELDELEQFDDT